MISNPLVSIIIPTFNRAHLIGETLDSVLSQTYTNWECIIVDDGSTDNTDEVIGEYLEKDNRFQYHHRPKGRLKGGNAARNYGFEVSKGEFVNWFDSDDIMVSTKIESKLKKILEEDCDFVVCKGALFESLPIIEPIPWSLNLEGNVLLNHVLGKISFVTNGPLFAKSFLLNNQPLFNESLLIRQEWEFFNRLLIKKPRITIITYPLYFYRKLVSGIRGEINYRKQKSKLVAERLTLVNINGINIFNEEENFIYKKMVYRRGIDFFNGFPLIIKLKLLPYLIRTFWINFSITFFKKYLKGKSQKY